MKKYIAIIIALVFVFSLAACGGGGGGGSTSTGGGTASSGGGTSGGDDTVYELKFDYTNPIQSHTGVILTEWADTIREESNGRINITIYPSSTLGPITAIPDNLMSGVSDIAWSTASTTSGRFPVMEGLQLVGLGTPNVYVSVESSYTIFESGLMDRELEGLHVISLGSFDPHVTQINKSTKEITSLADLKGLKLGTRGAYPTEMAIQLGMAPVTVPVPEMYESLSKNVVDLFWANVSDNNVFGFNEVIGQVIKTPVYTVRPYTLMNLNSYNNLPDDLKEIIDRNSGKAFAHKMSKSYEDQALARYDEFESLGILVTEFSAEDSARIEGTSESVHQIFIEDMNAIGYDGAAILAAYKEAIAKAIASQ